MRTFSKTEISMMTLGPAGLQSKFHTSKQNIVMTMFPTFLINFLITSYFLLAGPADTLAPSVTCPDNIVTVPDPVADSNNMMITLPQCSGDNTGGIGYAFFSENRNALNTDQVFSSMQTFPVATTTYVTCQVRDSAGNNGTCIYAVTVNSKCTILNCIETFLSVFEMSK